MVKLRLSPPSVSVVQRELDAGETKHIINNEEKDDEFLASRNDMEDMSPDSAVNGWAHAPYWPGVSHSQLALKPH